MVEHLYLARCPSTAFPRFACTSPGIQGVSRDLPQTQAERGWNQQDRCTPGRALQLRLQPAPAATGEMLSGYPEHRCTLNQGLPTIDSRILYQSLVEQQSTFSMLLLEIFMLKTLQFMK